jgi:hypothetical protein
MAITSIKTGSSFTNLVKYNDFLGPNSAYIPPSFESIATYTVAASETSISFNSIASTYKSLQIRYLAKRNDALNTSTCAIQFNSDTAANYVYHELNGNGTTVAASASTAKTNIGSQYVTGTTPTSTMGVGIIDILDYASTTKNKTVRSISGGDVNGTGGIVVLGSGLWLSTSAITSITLLVGSNWVNGSTFALYGIKG